VPQHPSNVGILQQDSLQHEEVSGQLTKRERDVIKSRYAGFNEAFTKVFALQSELSVPDGVGTLWRLLCGLPVLIGMSLDGRWSFCL
jgi:hypothetical protein